MLLSQSNLDQLLRTPLPRTPVNRGKRKGQDSKNPSPSLLKARRE
jgi:hypothetical protein